MIQINPIYHDIQLSFGASDVKRTVIKQSSDYTHILRIKLYDKGNDEIIINSGWDIIISAVKSDNKYILNSNNISVVNNSIQVTMTKQMLAAPGTEKCELIIQDGNQTLFSDTFLIYVDPNVQDGSFIESSNECGSIIDALDKINGYEKEALETKSHIVSVSNDVDNLKKDIEDTYDELEDAVTQTKDLITENKTIKDNENERNVNESNRITAESARVAEFNKIKNDAQTEITKLQNVNIEAIEGQESYQVKITDKDGNSKTSDNLLNKISIGTVDKGDYNESPSATITGEFGNQKLNLRLPTGNPFVISNTYSSISEMEADKENINLYDFVMINTGNVEDEDNGKLYMKDSNGMMFITDLSGVQGIQGVKGETGLTPNLTIGNVTTGEEGTKASVTITGTAENPIINFVIPRGNTGNAGEISALSLPYNGKDDTQTTKEVIDDALNKISANTTALDDKVDKVDGMGLSSNDYTTEEKTKLSGLNKQLLDKLGESTDGNLTFNNKEINAAQMIGATADEDGESGTVPQPTAGQENYVLKGDGTWKPEQEIIIDSELSDTSENSVQNKIIKAQIDSLNQAIEDAKALKASLEQYGMVKLNDTSVVTDSTGLALPTTEKNPNIDGTLANQISQLNTNLDSLSSIKIHHDGKWKEDTSQFSIYYYEGANTDAYDLPYPHCFVVVYKQSQGARGIALAYKWNNDGKSLNNSIIWMNKLHEYREWQGWYRILGTRCNITQPIANCSVFEYTTFYVVNFGYAKPSDVLITTLCPYADERAFASGMTFLGNICLSVDPDTKIEPVRVYIEYSGNIKIYSFTEKVFLDTYIIGQITVPKKQSI